ncbi:MAG: NAD(P)/FAD-dependent oxidoreductase [Actinobacteria bacterium]|jgi:NADH dehydrogenase|nr:NAD(P)/FAD-dependent oxidoreductase [Actinomycetota bacterium]NCV82651.1 NAD(P)/FAD-dependent oxidoreductase [Actinomycetota bacterium]NCW71886.1 NAD(P)/FAD-dependent oxidoreductase [Actinomycetota bacterium]NCW91766.1 NAD(P)/FAD-dependent oxidoreductase [Actinomycetota bacterium]NCX16408.1 NAD(P)/FAD-dependent oxidoreductase [Actinomycetota bacterium]
MEKTSQKPRVVILGAGFGGLTAAKAMADIAHVTVVDRHNFQTFLPLLYQVSTAGLAADHVAHPIRGALRKTGIQFRMGSPISIDHKNKTIKLDSSEVLAFDQLIVALGSVTADFSIPGVAEYALGMKSVSEALAIRAEVMRRFEDLCRFEDDTSFSISVVGGGPTGVEMAGAFAELVRGPLKNDQAHAAAHIRINLIEAGPRILPMFSEKLSARAKKDLEKLGVNVLLNTAVAELKPRSIIVKDGNEIASEVTIWAAGVKGEPAGGLLNLPLVSSRIDVDQSLQVKNYPGIFAIGDISGFVGKDGRFLPMVAPVAMQQGRFIAKQIKRLADGKALEAFKYIDKGSMATIGRHKAIVEVKNFRMAGIPAWYAWLWLHLFYLLGGRNKIGTMADWTWNYLTFDRGNRHIMDSV